MSGAIRFLSCRRLLVLLCLVTSTPAFSLDRVSLQLRWDHQFQFAGYYAAQWQGYYQEQGLEVEIRSAAISPSKFHHALDQVRSGQADFGIGGADILVANDRGAKLVVLATLFQQSAAILFSRGETPLDGPRALAGLRVARQPDNLIDIEMQTMLRLAGIDPDSIEPHPHQPGLAHLLSRQVDVVPGYSTGEQLLARVQNIHINTLKPSDFGVHFYGDSLFAREEYVQRHPELTRRFVEASLRGWKYALDHPQEVAARITRELPRMVPLPEGINLVFNLLQAQEVSTLTRYPWIDLGHTRLTTWQRMYATLEQAGLVSAGGRPDVTFLPLEQDASIATAKKRTLQGGIAGLLLLAAVLAWNRMLTRKASQIARSLTASERRFRETFEQAPVGIAHVDPSGCFMQFNPRFASILGYPQDALKKLGVMEITAPEFQADSQRAINGLMAGTLSTHQGEKQYRHSTGSLVWCRVVMTVITRVDSGKPDYLVVVIEDIDRRKQSEEREKNLQVQLQQAQRLDALGKLTGGIVHDFNNTLGIVLGYLQMAQLQAAQENSREIAAYLTLAAQAGVESKRLIGQLLLFARGDTGQPRPFELNQVLDDSLGLFKSALPSTVTLTLRGEASPVWISMDPTQFQQLLLNLLFNARDAIGDRGTIELHLERLNPAEQTCPGCRLNDREERPPDGEDTLLYLEQPQEGHWILLSVTDTGPGMDPATLQRMFDPFFTTKEAGKGTGMGLAIVHGIMKSGGGRITVDSSPGKGTRIKLFFPELRVGVPKIHDEPPPALLAPSPGTILVVDDEPGMARVIQRALEREGFTTLMETDSCRALAVFSRNPGAISLLITDQRMPGLTGLELAETMHHLKPGLPVILCSGELSLPAQSLVDAKIDYLEKPVNIEKLLERVAARLNR